MKIGLTGGIGSGKSTVARLMAARGARIVDADHIARDIVKPGSAVLRQLATTFGEDIINDDGSLKRQELARRAFVSEESTQRLNAITHPAIANEIRRALQQDGTVVLDHPLLLETASDALVDYVVVVDVPAGQRVRRLVDQRGLDAEDAKARIARQMGDEERRQRADYLIDNSGDLPALERQVEQVWEELHALQ
ncbi:dephospho-CoA kinase [Corynebacterium gerontici]|uniref:Dephospho-CoA kinase n=1 Tax=Corynebacterium gerontici TaxID=2079234 RepID=A0A3G6J046_9CORY|nr:dephospho-CoA kinase [Corynebacterium gerontici]AZA11327.1 Dephospho-CoA kinase [Corynebacterium gerontici]